MNEDINSFATPISENKPAGNDIKGDEDFLNIKDEIDKSFDIPDWNLISSLSATILKEKSKHLYVAAYMGEAEIQLNQFKGFISGLKLMCLLLENFGNDIYPKSISARNTAIKHWTIRSEALLPLHLPSMISENLNLEIEQDIKRLKNLLKQYLERPVPSLNPIIQILKTIPVEKKESKKKEKESEKIDKKESIPDDASQPKSENVSPEKQLSTSKKENKKNLDLKKTDSESLTDKKSIKRSINTLFGNIKMIARAIRDIDLKDTNSYYFNRFYCWGNISALPPKNAEGNTNIIAPDSKTINYLNRLEQEKKWSELLKESEGYLSANKFCLDLNHSSVIAANHLGTDHEAVAKIIEQEIGFFLMRFPGIEKLTFKDGSPFAESKTKKWLDQISISKGSSDNKHLESEDSKCFEILQDIHKKESYKEMIPLIQAQIKQAISFKNKQFFRSELINILNSHAQYEFMIPHLEIIMDEIEMFNIEKWDQDYALKVYMWAIKMYQLVSTEQAKSRMFDLHQRIIKLDLINAMKMFVESK
jgi:type VI secretion system protein VasJ